jgi:glycosyltransferase involved in cell wall biosynthesis
MMSAESKHVLFIVSQPYFQWRGSPIRVGFDVLALSESGYRVDLLLPPFGTDREIPGVRIHRVGRIPAVSNLPIGPSIPKLLFDVLLYFRARKLIALQQYDVIHGVEDAGIVCALLARKANAKFVFEKHSDAGSYRKGFLRNLIMSTYACVERWVIRKADGVVGTGPQLAQYAARIDSQKPIRAISDIPSSLVESDDDMTKTARARYEPDTNCILATYVGSFAVYQGIDLLFESIPVACGKQNDLRFLIIGGTDEEIAERRTQLAAAHVEDRVVFAGKIAPDKLPSVLAASDILLSPRIAGANTPLKLLDYLKVGRAIVATEHPANRQILTSETAVFAEARPDAYGKAIAKVAGDRTTRESIGRKGKALIAKKYNFAVFKHELASLYAELIERAGG